MIFADLVNGEAVFLDANTFVYHFAPDPLLRTPCGQWLQRIEKQDISGYTSTAVLSEVGHRLMTIEARTRPGWSSRKIVNRLKKNPAAVQNLVNFRVAVQRNQPTYGKMIRGDASIAQQLTSLINDTIS